MAAHVTDSSFVAGSRWLPILERNKVHEQMGNVSGKKVITIMPSCSICRKSLFLSFS